VTSSWFITGLRELVRRHSWVAVEAILLDRFAPPALWQRQELRQRIRMFVLSHLIGPPLGLAMVGYLFALHPVVDAALLVFVAAISGFSAYPWALRRTGRFTLLAFVSLQQLTFVILFVSYHYGGMSSPFFFWLLVVPLFGLFYLGDLPRMRWAVIGALVAEVALFTVALRIFGPAPARIPAAAVDGMILVSVICASVYVTLMALSHARVLASQSELQREVEDHRRTAEQLRSASQAAEAASRAKTEFLATMSHELRTPLNAIIGFAEVMRAGTFGELGERYRGYVTDIEESGCHLLEIINDILDIVKTEAGRLELVEEPVDVTQLLAAVERLLASRAAKASLTMSVALDPDLPLLRADGRKMKQMLLNLVANAIKFTPAGGSVAIDAQRSPAGGVAITVADTGIGIAEEHLGKVLEPFYQVDSSLARQHEGTGLGLTVVAAMASGHGAQLRLDSRLGAGTVATLDFPAFRVVREDAGAPPQALAAD
jgi:signal transduction histidine kinase